MGVINNRRCRRARVNSGDSGSSECSDQCGWKEVRGTADSDALWPEDALADLSQCLEECFAVNAAQGDYRCDKENLI